jgi:hypothetical protein
MPGLPDPLERRTLLQPDQKRPVDHAAIAERYLAEERKSEALDFIDKIDDAVRRDALRARVREAAVALGDFFLLTRLDNLSKIGDADWRKALESAKAQGKTRFAIKLARKVGDTVLAEALEASIGIVRPVVAAAAAAPPIGSAVPDVPAGDGKKDDAGSRTV